LTALYDTIYAMSQRKVGFAHGEFYHIYNRGNSKQVIFKNITDHRRFQQMLYAMNSREGVTFRFIEKEKMYTYDRGEQLVYIGAYCLMPNHFHILLTPAVEQGVQTFMQKLSTGYSMYFNKRYERSGGLFEGRFKSQHVGSDEYLKYLFAYIHLNPLKLIDSKWKEQGLKNTAGAEKYLTEYRFSSFSDFLKQREECSILHIESFPEYFPNRESFLEEINEWMNFRAFAEPVKDRP